MERMRPRDKRGELCAGRKSTQAHNRCGVETFIRAGVASSAGVEHAIGHPHLPRQHVPRRLSVSRPCDGAYLTLRSDRDLPDQR